MYANVIQLTFKSENDFKQAEEKLNALLPALRQVQGFQAFYAIQTAPQEALLITVYDSEAAAQAGGVQMGPQVVQAAGPHVASAPQRMAGNVITHG